MKKRTKKNILVTSIVLLIITSIVLISYFATQQRVFGIQQDNFDNMCDINKNECIIGISSSDRATQFTYNYFDARGVTGIKLTISKEKCSEIGGDYIPPTRYASVDYPEYCAIGNLLSEQLKKGNIEYISGNDNMFISSITGAQITAKTHDWISEVSSPTIKFKIRIYGDVPYSTQTDSTDTTQDDETSTDTSQTDTTTTDTTQTNDNTDSTDKTDTTQTDTSEITETTEPTQIVSIIIVSLIGILVIWLIISVVRKRGKKRK